LGRKGRWLSRGNACRYFVACCGVSTAQQGRSGLGLEAQQQAVRAYLDGGCWKLIGEHTEVESGKLRDRPQLKAALEQCRVTGATLVIAARKRGKRLGGWRATRRRGEPRSPPGAFQAAATAAAKARAWQRAARVLPIARELKGCGMSLRQIAVELTERHVATPRGGAWSVTSVRNLLHRTCRTPEPDHRTLQRLKRRRP
jgi:DNA invertase Pin-like site-specific DNA recombinase